MNNIKQINIQYESDGLWGNTDTEAENINVESSERNYKFSLVDAIVEQYGEKVKVSVCQGSTMYECLDENGIDMEDEQLWLMAFVEEHWSNFDWVVYND